MKVFDIKDVKEVNWESLDIAPLGGDMAEDLIAFINRSVRYCTHTWWKEKKFHKMNKSNFLTVKFNQERVVMAMANMARLLGTALKFNIFDGEVAKITYQKAQDHAMKLLRTLNFYNIANMANGWRSVSVAAETAVAGMIMWDKLNRADKTLMVNMLDYTASELLDSKAAFRYITEEEGSTRAIYNNVNKAKVLNIAANVMPDHEKAQKWQVKANFFAKASTAIVSDGMKGYNITEQGLAYNNIGIDIEEMLAINNLLDNILVNQLLEKPPITSFLGNSNLIYSSLSNLHISRSRRSWETIYRTNIDGQLLPELNLTVKMKGKEIKSLIVDSYLLDCNAYCCGLDVANEMPAKIWAEVRMAKMQLRQKAHGKNSYFSSLRGRNWVREAKIASRVAQAYAMLYFKVVKDCVEESQPTSKSDDKVVSYTVGSMPSAIDIKYKVSTPVESRQTAYQSGIDEADTGAAEAGEISQKTKARGKSGKIKEDDSNQSKIDNIEQNVTDTAAGDREEESTERTNLQEGELGEMPIINEDTAKVSEPKAKVTTKGATTKVSEPKAKVTTKGATTKASEPKAKVTTKGATTKAKESKATPSKVTKINAGMKSDSVLGEMISEIELNSSIMPIAKEETKMAKSTKKQ